MIYNEFFMAARLRFPDNNLIRWKNFIIICGDGQFQDATPMEGAVMKSDIFGIRQRL